MYRDQVRRGLSKFGGYECQEAEGEFMLAFPLLMQAVDFCLMVSCEEIVISNAASSLCSIIVIITAYLTRIDVDVWQEQQC